MGTLAVRTKTLWSTRCSRHCRLRFDYNISVSSCSSGATTAVQLQLLVFLCDFPAIPHMFKVNMFYDQRLVWVHARPLWTHLNPHPSEPPAPTPCSRELSRNVFVASYQESKVFVTKRSIPDWDRVITIHAYKPDCDVIYYYVQTLNKTQLTSSCVLYVHHLVYCMYIILCTVCTSSCVLYVHHLVYCMYIILCTVCIYGCHFQLSPRTIIERYIPVPVFLFVA